MQKGLVSYKLLSEGWDVSDHFGGGYDLTAEKENRFIKIELKAIDLNSIKKGNHATQRLSANELVTATHLIVTVFNNIEMKGNYVMSIRQFVENSGIKKYKKYSDFTEFMDCYKQLAKEKSLRRKNSTSQRKQLYFDINFNPENIEYWKFYRFKDVWENLKKGEQGAAGDL